MRTAPIVLILLTLANAASADEKAPVKEPRPYGLDSRELWTTSRVVGAPDPPPPFTVEVAFPKLKFDGPVYVAQEPGTNRFLVGEQSGKIFAFTADTVDNESRELFLDVGRDLYSFSFHPDYAKNGRVFTFSPRDPKDKSKEKLSRVSRYTASTATPRKCDPKSEEIIVEWPAGGHNGGEAIIGPDGYLYVSTGDSTSGSDLKSTGQGVNDLLSVIMRLDVDHPSGDRAYSIPKDNPFVDYPGARPEIWAFGFRNPWRMSFDQKTGDLWVGDVGQDLWEMIWKVRRGGNYGWSVQEGAHPFHPNKPSGPGPILPPVVEHHHSECRSITGGYVYHGSKFPELRGAYFYGDYEYGMIWAVREENGKAVWNKLLADTALRIASFGVSREGDILLVEHPSGQIYKLTRAKPTATNAKFPRRLSETGLFADVARHSVAAGVIPYSVNVPQWLDGASANRFLATPGDSKIKLSNPWGFADGTVNFETISMQLDADRPDSIRRIETRILVKQENHWLGYSYLWNDEQTDAQLVESKGRDIPLRIADRAAEGGRRDQMWRVPSRNECMFCHSRAAGFVLGLRTEQMNRDHDYGGVTDNQLRALNHVELFEKALNKPPEKYPALPEVYASSGDVRDRARAYLHVNCSVCHVSDGGGNAKIQLRLSQSFESTGLNERPLHGDFGLNHAKLVSPGDPYASVLFYRLSKWGRGRMPHIGSNVHDQHGLDLVHDWIAGMDGEQPPSPGAADTTLAERIKVREVVGRLSELAGNERRTEIERQLTSSRRALILARWISGRPNSKLRRQIVQLGASHNDPNVRDLFERFLPPGQRTQRLGNDIRIADVLDRAGDPERGRQFFLTSKSSQCVNCHRVGEQGASLGPDLSGVGKKLKPEEILESLIYPSRKIDPKFVTQNLRTIDGKTYSGLLVSKSDRNVVLNVLRDGKPQEVRISAGDVDEVQTQDKSLMPDGLLRDLTAQQAADLLAFLSSLKTPLKEP